MRTETLFLNLTVGGNGRKKNVMGCVTSAGQTRDRSRVLPAVSPLINPGPRSVVTSYYFNDFDGNVDALVSPSGMILAQYEYDPFGNLIAKGGLMADLNKYRFSSKEWEQNAGLYYYLYRFFDPNLQRWLNRDPIQEKGGINLYEFAMNAPVDNVDGYGLFDLTPPPPPPIPNLTPHDPTNSPTPPTQPPQGPGPTNVPPATYVPISPWTNKPPNFTSSGWFENDGSGVPMFCSGEDTNGLPTGPTVWNGNPVAPIGH